MCPAANYAFYRGEGTAWTRAGCYPNRPQASSTSSALRPPCQGSSERRLLLPPRYEVGARNPYSSRRSSTTFSGSALAPFSWSRRRRRRLIWCSISAWPRLRTPDGSSPPNTRATAGYNSACSPCSLGSALEPRRPSSTRVGVRSVVEVLSAAAAERTCSPIGFNAVCGSFNCRATSASALRRVDASVQRKK